LLSFLLLQSL